MGPGHRLRDRATAGPGRRPEVLSLLLAGLTDASVAKQLDLGLRTVQRRVKRLMDLTGVTTRLQLGWHAYERGWVAGTFTTDPDPRVLVPGVPGSRCGRRSCVGVRLPADHGGVADAQPRAPRSTVVAS